MSNDTKISPDLLKSGDISTDDTPIWIRTRNLEIRSLSHYPFVLWGRRYIASF